MQIKTLEQFQPNDKIVSLIERGDQAGLSIVSGDTPEAFSQSFQHAIQRSKMIREQRKQLREQGEPNAY
ncbi:hypothetical protein A1D22_01485 [Pasteurellaceae bacterium LFhippo2]|nr:hypothetical protein [Pasteurellaceae bacterium LFhippo2]